MSESDNSHVWIRDDPVLFGWIRTPENSHPAAVVHCALLHIVFLLLVSAAGHQQQDISLHLGIKGKTLLGRPRRVEPVLCCCVLLWEQKYSSWSSLFVFVCFWTQNLKWNNFGAFEVKSNMSLLSALQRESYLDCSCISFIILFYFWPLGGTAGKKPSFLLLFGLLWSSRGKYLKQLIVAGNLKEMCHKTKTSR